MMILHLYVLRTFQFPVLLVLVLFWASFKYLTGTVITIFFIYLTKIESIVFFSNVIAALTQVSSVEKIFDWDLVVIAIMST